MERNSELNIFTKGLNKDVAKSVQPKDSYYHAENVRILTDSSGRSSGAMINVRGNSHILDIDEGYVLGYTTIRDYIIVFSVTTSGVGQIWKIARNDVIYSTQVPPLLVYQDVDLGFSVNNLIDAVGLYESTDVQKVYWTDNNNEVRMLNVVSSTGVYPITDVPVENLGLVNAVMFSVPKLNEILSGGSRKAGVIQYAYKLYNLYGVETSLSPLSNLISLTDSDERISESFNYDGADKGTDTGKSIKFDINDIDDRFGKIKVYAIFYEDNNDVPTIELIKDTSIPTSGNLTVIDDGTVVLEQYSLDEFNFLGGTIFTCKSLKQKKNILFAANIKEKQYDVDYDARAYRYLDDGVTSYVHDADSINPYNTLKTHDGSKFFKYQTDGSTLGGEGPNVTYKFVLTQIEGDGNFQDTYVYTKPAADIDIDINRISYLNAPTYKNRSFNNYNSPYLSGLLKGYQRDEVYRFGIVFIDKYGRESFVKWIADIRMPHISDIDFGVTYYTELYDTYAPVVASARHDFSTAFKQKIGTGASAWYRNMLNVLGVEFYVNPNTLPDDIVGYRIVRVEREEKDKSVICQGLIEGNSVHEAKNEIRPNTTLYSGGDVNNTTGVFGLVPDGRIYTLKSSRSFLLSSPEINFKKELSNKSGDYIHVVGIGKDFTYSIPGAYGAEGTYTNKMRRVDTLNTSELFTFQKDVHDGRIVPVGYGNTYDVGDPNNRLFRNYTYDNASGMIDHIGGYRGTCFVGSINSVFGNTIIAYNNYFAIANYKRTLTSQYGGNTATDRSRNEYISCGHYFKIPTDPGDYNPTDYVTVYGGDTFIAYYTYQRVIWNDDGHTSPISGENENRYSDVIHFPVETSINLELRQDTHFSQYRTYKLCETQAMGEIFYGASYSDTYTDLYLYNDVYSKENNAQVYYPEPDDYSASERIDNRIKYSDTKIAGEFIDNWTIFREGNYVDAESIHGPINHLELFRDNLLLFQDNSFGTISVMPRVSVQGSDGISMEIGTGSVIQDINYISTEIGCKHKWSITSSDSACYFFDINTKNVYKFSGQGTQSLSDIKGMSSFFSSELIGNILTGDNPLLSKGIVSTYDSKYNEVIFTFRDNYTVPGADGPTYNYFTISYNELIDVFTSFYSFTPSIYINDGKRILSCDPNTPHEIYEHDTGEYNSFYDDLYNSNLSLVVNQYPANTKVFDNISYHMEVIDSNDVNRTYETFNTVRCKTDYQDSGIVTLVPKTDFTTAGYNIRRAEREWQLSVPRNDSLSVTQFKDRLRDKYMMVDLSYNNILNRRFILHYIKNYYRVSPR